MRAILPVLATLGLLACQAGPSGAPQGAKVNVPAATAPAPAADTVVARWNGGEYRYADLEQDIRTQLTRLEVDYLNGRHDAMTRAIEQKVTTDLLDAEAKRRGLADADALLAQVEKETTEPSELEISAFYEENKRRFGDRGLEEVRPMIAANLVRGKQREAMTALVEDLRSKAGVEVLLAAPDLPRIEVSVDDDFPRGPAEAPVTIIEFADFQCPYCGRGFQTMKQIMEEYPGKVRWVYRDFPLSNHRQAVPAAVAANCAGAQGKYWEMHDWLLENQRSLDDASLETGAAALGLDMDAWKTCRQDEAQTTEVLKDMTDGSAAGVTGTPAYFINGILVSGARPVEDFRAIIDRELEVASGR